MLIAINGEVYNSEDERVSLLLYKNEREAIVRAVTHGDDIFSSVPKGTSKKEIEENVNRLNEVKQALEG